MSKKKGLRFFTRSIFDIPRWLGWESLKNNASSITRMYYSLVKLPEKPSFHETYEEAVMRLKLTSADIEKSVQNYRTTSTVYFLLFVFGLLYHFYLVYNRHWVSAFVMVSFDLMLFSFWFRESFWLMQITKRKLGLTFKDWVCHILDIS